MVGNLTITIRILLLASLVLYIIYNNYSNNLIKSLWTILINNKLFTHDTFEPLLASLSFLIWMSIYGLIYHIPFFNKYKIVNNTTTPNTKKDYKIGRLQSILAGISYLAPFFLFDNIYPRRKERIASLHYPSLYRIVFDVSICLLIYDFLFYFIHLAFHSSKRLYKIHAKHHSERILTSSDTINVSFIDGTLQVLCSVIAVNVSQAHPLSRALYNIMITLMLTEIHSGYDLPFMTHNIVPLNILGGSVKHFIHHKEGDKYFHQFFNYLDSISINRKN